MQIMITYFGKIKQELIMLKVINYLNENNVYFVRKNDNPVNVPECRPI